MTNEEVEEFLLKKAETGKAFTNGWLSTTAEALAKEAGCVGSQIAQVLRNMQNEGKIELMIIIAGRLCQSFSIRLSESAHPEFVNVVTYSRPS
jgi:hypothetical protein